MTPNAVFADLDPFPILNIRKGYQKDLFHPDSLINGKEDSGNSFSNAYFEQGRDIIDVIVDRIRKISEGCDSV